MIINVLQQNYHFELLNIEFIFMITKNTTPFQNLQTIYSLVLNLLQYFVSKTI